MPAKKNKRIKENHQQNHLKKKAWVYLSTSLAVGIIASVLAYYLIQSYLDPVQKGHNTTYCILDAVPREAQDDLHKQSGYKINELNDMFVISANPDQPMNINYIKIHNVARVNKSLIYCSQNDVNQAINNSVINHFNPEHRTFTISNIPTIPQGSKLIAVMYGIIDKELCNPVLVMEDKGLVFPIKSGVVTEPQLFLARYWQHILVVNIFILLIIYYLLKNRLEKLHGNP